MYNPSFVIAGGQRICHSKTLGRLFRCSPRDPMNNTRVRVRVRARKNTEDLSRISDPFLPYTVITSPFIMSYSVKDRFAIVTGGGSGK